MLFRSSSAAQISLLIQNISCIKKSNISPRWPQTAKHPSVLQRAKMPK